MATYDPDDPVDADVLMPEYLTCEDKSEQVAGHVIEWLTDPAKRAARVAQLAELKERVGHGGASRRAADYMLDVLDAASGRRCGRIIRSPRRSKRRSAARREPSDFGLRIADCGLNNAQFAHIRNPTIRNSQFRCFLANQLRRRPTCIFGCSAFPVRVHPFFWVVTLLLGHGRRTQPTRSRR